MTSLIETKNHSFEEAMDKMANEGAYVHIERQYYPLFHIDFLGRLMKCFNAGSGGEYLEEIESIPFDMSNRRWIIIPKEEMKRRNDENQKYIDNYDEERKKEFIDFIKPRLHDFKIIKVIFPRKLIYSAYFNKYSSPLDKKWHYGKTIIFNKMMWHPDFKIIIPTINNRIILYDLKKIEELNQ